MRELRERPVGSPPASLGSPRDLVADSESILAFRELTEAYPLTQIERIVNRDDDADIPEALSFDPLKNLVKDVYDVTLDNMDYDLVPAKLLSGICGVCHADVMLRWDLQIKTPGRPSEQCWSMWDEGGERNRRLHVCRR